MTLVLRAEEMNAINGLIHYLNEKFDGHGLLAQVTLSGIAPDGAVQEPPKGEIVVTDRVTLEDDATGLIYAWRADL